MNCGAIPENLLEAEFFEPAKGSYTGATQDRDGYFQAARGRHPFLDGSGEICPWPCKSKLLRAIQERSRRPRLALRRKKRWTCGFVSATHCDPRRRRANEKGRFRYDRVCIFRLNVIEIIIPPLA